MGMSVLDSQLYLDDELDVDSELDMQYNNFLFTLMIYANLFPLD